jgi:hypothetical protein
MLRLNSQRFDSLADDAPHCSTREGTIGGLQRKKNKSAGAPRASVLKIVKDSFAHFILNRELLDATSFGSMDAERFVSPIKVV